MDQIEPLRIAAALKSSPAWARLGLTSAKESLVDRAADTMAAIIVARLTATEDLRDDRNMTLPIL